MRRKLKKLIALVLAFALIPALPVFAVPVVIESGNVGAGGAPWRLYNNGNLVVSEGRINNSGGVSPWNAYRNNIMQIIFEGPITAGNSLRALFLDLSYVESITGLELFDTSNTTNMHSVFSGVSGVTSLNISGWDTSRATNMGNMFAGASGLTSLDVSSWDISRVTSTNSMFRNVSGITALDLSNWDTGNITNMSAMFYDTRGLTTIDVSNWETGNVTNMSHMFRNTDSLTTLDVSNWDTSNVTIMSTMFYGASALTALDVSGWDVSSVTTMNRMFSNAAALTNLDVSAWDTSNVTDMLRLFNGVSSLTSLDVSTWSTSRVTNMAGMFNGAENISSLDVSDWDTSNVTSMERMFQDTHQLTSLDVSGWNTGNVTNMGSMFFGASGLTLLDVSSWDTSRVTNMLGMFRNAGALTTLDVSNWDTARVTSMGTMFYGASALTALNVSDWDTRSVTTMDRMFSGVGNVTVLDVSGWYTGNVLNMNSVFRNVSGVSTLDVSNWNTGSATSMSGMFFGTGSVTTLEVSNWNTGNVTVMNSMFQGSGVTNLDVSDWDTGRVTNMQNMFMDATGLTALDLFRWNVSSVTSMHSMFRGASSLASLDMSDWNTASVTTMHDMLRGTSSLRRITFGSGFVNGTSTNPNLPNRALNAEFTGLWLNITPPGGMNPVPSGMLFPTTGGGPFAPGIWVWERHEGIVMISVDGTYRFPTVAVGYPAIPPLHVAVANAGRTEINVPLNVTLSGANTDDFILIPGNLPPNNVIPIGSSWADAFSIVPQIGLQPGIYTAIVTVSGAGINTETFTVSFTVLPDSIENAVITFADTVFNGSPQQPALTVTLEGEVLIEGIDFEIIQSSWINNINARNFNDTNPPSVTIRGINAFDRPGSEATGVFTIRQRPVTLTRGNFSITKAYDGTASSAVASTTGSLALGNLIPNDSLRVRAEWTSISDYSGTDVGDYEVTMLGLRLVSINNDDWHLNYDLGITMLTEIPARITPANFPPALPIERTAMTGAARTITIPLSQLTPVPTAPMSLGLVSSVDVHNYAPGLISATATIAGENLVITTCADKAFPNTETITVRFDTHNFGNIDMQVLLTTANASLTVSPETVTINDVNLTATVTIGGTAEGPVLLNSNLPPGVSATVVGTTITITGTRPVHGENAIIGTYTVTVTRGGLNESLTVNVNLTPEDASAPAITIVTHPAAMTVVSGSALNIDLYVIATVTQDATLSYQWFMNGTPIAGATSATFPIPDNLAVGAYNFYVVVSAVGATSVTSNVAVVIVKEEGIRGITLNPGGNHSFPEVSFGYGLQEAHAVTIANIGTVPTGLLTLALSGTNADSFELSIISIADIAVDGSAIFAIRPITGLGVGVYSAIVTIMGEEILESFTVSFIVNAPAIITTPSPQPTPIPNTPSPQLTPMPSPQPTSSPAPMSTPTSTPTSTPILTPTPTSSPPPADPKPPPYYYTPALNRELHQAYMFGDANGLFRPRGNLTRAEAATILARIYLLDFEHGISILPLGMTTFNAFEDVRPGQWFYYYVAWVYDAGLIQGFAGNFRPNDPITREELAAIIVRTGAINRPAGQSSFPDAAIISNWARAYVSIAYQEGIIVGDPDGNFRPGDNITRAETATAINRLLGRIDSRTALNAAYVENINHARRFPDVEPSSWFFASVVGASNDHYATRDGTEAIDWILITR